ncbi:MAG: glycosyltransferase [Bacilli bacterium]|nr:glycosyltransferase [Bacilli bacterium]
MYENIGIKNALRTSIYAFRIWKNKKLFHNKDRFFRNNHSFWLAYERGFRHSLEVLFFQFRFKKRIYKRNGGFPTYKNFDILLHETIKNGGSILNHANAISDKFALLISHELSFTGAPFVLLHTAAALKELGVTPVIVSPSNGPLVNEAKKLNITVILYRDIYSNDYIVSMASFFDFVIVNTIVCSRLIQKFNYTNIPIMWWIHEAKESYIYDKANMPTRISSNIKVYAGGQYALKLIKKYRPNYPVKELLYYSPECNKFSNIDFIEEKMHGKKIFACIGTLSKRKGQLLLLDAILHLRKQTFNKSLFIFVGENCDLPTFTKLSELTKKYPNNFVYLQRLPPSKLASIYKKMDALICPSLDDPMPMVVAAALSLNKHVISSSNTGFASLLLQHKCGAVFKSGNRKELISCIEDAFSKTNNSSKAGLLIYRRHFAKSIFLRNIANIYFFLAKSSQNSMKRFINSLPSEYLNQINLRQMFKFNRRDSILLINPNSQKILNKSLKLTKKYNVLIGLTDNFKLDGDIDLPIIHFNKQTDIKPFSFNMFKKVIIDKIPSETYFGILKNSYNLSFIESNRTLDCIERKSVSVVIPTYNPGPELFKSIALINSQKKIKHIEIILVDSGSNPQLIKKMKSYPNVYLYSILHDKFSHSYSRNFGISKARYCNVVFMTQDAIPTSKTCFYNLIKPLILNKAVASSCREKNPPKIDPYYGLMSKSFTKFINYGHKPIRSYQYDHLKEVSNLSNVCCAVRHDILENYPYRFNYGEDFDLGIRLILNNYKLAFINSCAVLHGHNRDALYYFKREIVESAFSSNLFSTVYQKKNFLLLKNKIKSIAIDYAFINYWLSLILKNNYIVSYRTFLKCSKTSFDKIVMSKSRKFTNKIYNFENDKVHKIVSRLNNSLTSNLPYDYSYSNVYNFRSYIYENVIEYMQKHHIAFSKQLIIKVLYKKIVAVTGSTLGALFDYHLVKKIITEEIDLNV